MTTSTRIKVRSEGLGAALKGKKLSDNPYPVGSEKWAAWQDGWVEGDKSKDLKRYAR